MHGRRVGENVGWAPEESSRGFSQAGREPRSRGYESPAPRSVRPPRFGATVGTARDRSAIPRDGPLQRKRTLLNPATGGNLDLARVLLARWNRLHAARSALSLVALVVFLAVLA
jgi:hypothetical protein